MNQQTIHLLHRTGFGVTADEFEFANDSTIEDAITYIFDQSQSTIPIIYKGQHEEKINKLNKGKRVKARLAKRVIAMRWLQHIATCKEQLREKMALFWHDHFPVNIEHPVFTLKYVNTIRQHALGNFGDLLFAVSKEPAMISYLNANKNVKGHPNENFAREVMELFTLGIGHYTEKDIMEAARAFTGWFYLKDGKFAFRKRFHDKGEKTILNQTGKFNGDDVLGILLNTKQTSVYITQKIWKYFTGNDIDKQLLDKLSSLFFEYKYDISVLLKEMFRSVEFYEEKNIGVRIKSPTELIIDEMRLCQISIKNPGFMYRLQESLGQIIMYPPSVEGWNSGKSWIDMNTISTRLELINYLMETKPLHSKKALLSLEGDEEINRPKKNPTFNLNVERLKEFFELNISGAASRMMLLLYNKEYSHLNSLFNLLAHHYQKEEITFDEIVKLLLSQPEYQLN